MAWYALAEALGMPLQRCQRETTSTEFVEWKLYFAKKWNTRTPDQYYLAQIAQEVRRVLHKSPKQVKLEQFLIGFTHDGPAAPRLSAKEIAAKAEASRSFWMAAVGYKGK